MQLNGRVAAVTGAGSGIGRALAQQLAARGAHLALSDIDEVGLAATVASCQGRGVGVTSAVVDVADRDAVRAWADAVAADHGRVNLIVNNAGVALIAPIEEMSHEDLRWLIDINFWGVVHGTEAFLPHLRAAGEGHVVNVSSIFGLMAIPSQSAYNAAKFAVRGYTDCLRIELEIAGGGVSATTVHPGGIRTDIVRRARVAEGMAGSAGPHRPEEFDRLARTSPERAARRILDGVERNRRRVLVGPDAVAFDLLARLPASVTQRLLVAGGRRQFRRTASR